jgi:hypothetical protein
MAKKKKMTSTKEYTKSQATIIKKLHQERKRVSISNQRHYIYNYILCIPHFRLVLIAQNQINAK